MSCYSDYGAFCYHHLISYLTLFRSFRYEALDLLKLSKDAVKDIYLEVRNRAPQVSKRHFLFFMKFLAIVLKKLCFFIMCSVVKPGTLFALAIYGFELAF